MTYLQLTVTFLNIVDWAVTRVILHFIIINELITDQFSFSCVKKMKVTPQVNSATLSNQLQQLIDNTMPLV